MPPCRNATISIIKKFSIIFQKWGGGGQRPFGIFPFGSRTLPLERMQVGSTFSLKMGKQFLTKTKKGKVISSWEMIMKYFFYYQLLITNVISIHISFEVLLLFSLSFALNDLGVKYFHLSCAFNCKKHPHRVPEICRSSHDIIPLPLHNCNLVFAVVLAQL